MKEKLMYLKEIADKIEGIQNSCNHNWGEIKRDSRAVIEEEPKEINFGLKKAPELEYFWSCECQSCGLKLYDSERGNLVRSVRVLSKKANRK